LLAEVPVVVHGIRFKIIITGFGMTEVSAVSHVIPPEVKNSKAGSSGILAPGMKSKIVNPDTGETVGRNVPGEIYLKGPNVMCY
jgi:acyl-CoA synthetase (AMP-forming)/AMP-acid ligase II